MTTNTKTPDIRELRPRITVFGVGGAGGNAVNNMISAGLQGVVASPHETAAIRTACGADFAIVTPGIRGASAGQEKNDQARTMGPAEGGMILLDSGWTETIRERQRQETWRIWGRKREEARA